MNKKKLTKVALTTALAASAFVAANPAQADASSDAAALVRDAQVKANALRPLYNLTSAEDIAAPALNKAVAEARTAINKAKNAGLTPDLQAQLASAEEHWVRAARLVDAQSLNASLTAKRAELKVLVEAGTMNDALQAAFNAHNAEIKKAERAFSRIFGAENRAIVNNAYILPSKIASEGVMWEVTEYGILKAADAAVKANDLAKAEAELAKLDRVRARGVAHKAAGNELHPGKFPANTALNASLATQATAVQAAFDEKNELKVVGVSAINAMQIEVKFNKPVTKETAQNVTNYKVQDVALVNAAPALSNKAELSEDGKTVILTLSLRGALANNVAYSVTVENIKTAAGEELDTFRTSFMQNDKTAPVVNSVEAKAGSTGTRTVTVKLSEPVQTAGTFTVNGVAATVSPLSNTDFSKRNELTLTTSQTLVEGQTYTLVAASASDYAGNVLVSQTVQFTVESVTTAAKLVSVTPISETQVKFTYDRAINTNTIPATTANTNLKVERVGGNFNSPTASSAAIDADDNKSVIVTIGTPGYSTITKSIVPIISLKGLKDVFGNDVEEVKERQVTLVKDEVKPSFVKATVSSDNKYVLVELSEAVTAGSVADADALALTVINADSVDVSNTVFNGTTQRFDKAVLATSTGATSAAASSKFVKFYNNADNTLRSGTFTVSLAAGAFTDTAIAPANTSEALQFTITVSSLANTVRPTVAAGPFTTSALDATSRAQTLTLGFGTEMNNTALNVANYTLNGAALPAGTTIVFTSTAKNEVRLSFPKGSFNANSALNLVVSNVQNSGGLAITAPALRTLNVKDNTVPTIVSAKALRNGNLEIVFSENVNVNTVGNIQLVDENGTTIRTANASTGTGTRSIIVTGWASESLAGLDLTKVKVKILADAVRDTSLQTNANELTNNITIADEYVTAPAFTAAQVAIAGNASDIRLTFTNIANLRAENVVTLDVYAYAVAGAVTADNASGFTVAESININSVNADGQVRLSVATTTDSKTGATLNLANGQQPYFTVVARDAIGNVVYSSQVQLGATLDYAAPTFNSVSAAGNVATLTFSENVYFAELTAADLTVTVNGTARTITPVTARVVGSAASTVAVTFDGAAVAEDDVVVVTLTTSGAAKVLDVMGNSSATQARSFTVPAM